MSLNETNNTFAESIEEVISSETEIEYPQNVEHDFDIDQIKKEDLFRIETKNGKKLKPFVINPVAGGYSSWSTSDAKTLLKKLGNCKTGGYIALQKRHMHTSDIKKVIPEFEKRFEDLLLVTDKIGSGDLLERLKALFSKNEQIGKFLDDPNQNKENLSKKDWWYICFPNSYKDVYETIERKLQEFNRNSREDGKPYAMAELNQTNGTNGTARATMSAYFRKASIEEMEEVAIEVENALSVKYHMKRIGMTGVTL